MGTYTIRWVDMALEVLNGNLRRVLKDRYVGQREIKVNRIKLYEGWEHLLSFNNNEHEK